MAQHPRQEKSPARFGWLFAAAAIVLGAGVATRAAVRQNQQTKPVTPASQPSAKDAQTSARAEEEFARVGEALVKKVCDTSCHGLEKLDEMRRMPREWNDSVTSMVTRGALATDSQFATITKYLTRYYGAVSVNTAPAEELSAVLGLSSHDAAAIVEYRRAHGKFTDAGALMGVPGIDKSRIEEQPDALRFN